MAITPNPAEDRFASAVHTHDAAAMVSGTVAAARLGSGTADNTTFLRGDGSWQVPPSGSGGVSDGDKGDITVSGSGATWTIDAGAVDTSKLGGDVTAAGKALLDDADAAAQRATLGLGTAATQNTGAFEASGAVAAGVSAHEAAGDPHPQYLTAAEADAAYQETLVSGTNIKTVNGSSLLGSGDLSVGGVSYSKVIAAQTDVAINNSTTFQTLVTHAMASVAAGQMIEIEVTGTVLNNSGATVTPVIRATFGALTVDVALGTTVAASATNRAPFRIKATLVVTSSSSAAATVEWRQSAPGAANTGLSIATTTYRHGWQTSAANLTGTITCSVGMRSSTNTATQTCHVFTARILKVAAV